METQLENIYKQNIKEAREMIDMFYTSWQKGEIERSLYIEKKDKWEAVEIENTENLKRIERASLDTNDTSATAICKFQSINNW